MITTLFAGVLTSALLLSSALPASETPIKPSVSPIVFTQVLPEGNFVAHTVHEGETLETIAEDHYGDSAYWKTVWNDNEWIEDPNALEAGLLIKLRLNKPETPDDFIARLTEDIPVPEVEQTTIAYTLPTFTPVPTRTPTLTLVPSFTPTIAQVVTSTPAPVNSPPATYEEVYKQAGAKYGVPWQILYGLHMTETGGRDGAIFNHQGSGAQGPMQFMPGTWRAYGVDGNGDGIADINNAVDAINSAANFLAKHRSLAAGLQSYGGNTVGTLSLARQKGFSL